MDYLAMSRSPDQHKLIDPRKAQQTVLAHVSPLSDSPIQWDPADHSAVAAEAVHADRDLPPADVSRMDGYAVVAPLPAGAELQVVDEIPAGTLPQRAIAERECSRIFTGSVVPPNANAVVEQEAVAAGSSDATITLNRPILPGENITPRGSVAQSGAIVLEPGTPLGAAQVALAAAVGQMPPCRPSPRLAIICTGQEVVEEGAAPGPHQTRDINGPSVSAAARSIGATVGWREIVPDDLDCLAQALRRALQDATIHAVIAIGGVSVGDYDLVPDTLRSLGARIVLHRVAAKPGKPFLFAMSRNSKPVFGLPGNPLSVLTSFFEFVAPALRKMAGRPEPWAPSLAVILSADVERDRERVRFALARVRQANDGDWLADPISFPHSADVVAAGKADGVVIIPTGQGCVPAGQRVAFRPWRPLW